MYERIISPLVVFCLAIPLSQAATVAVQSYNYTAGDAPSGLYPDDQNGDPQAGMGMGELIDGVFQTTVWGGGNSPTASDIAPLVGWENSDPSITFDFFGTEQIQLVEIWSADSDTSAGVLLPDTVTIRTPDGSFSRTFDVTNPPGNGSMVRLDFTGFDVLTSSLIVEPRRAVPGVTLDDWIMLSEVRFDSVPEPGSLSLLGFIAATFLRRRR